MGFLRDYSLNGTFSQCRSSKRETNYLSRDPFTGTYVRFGDNVLSRDSEANIQSVLHGTNKINTKFSNQNTTREVRVEGFRQKDLYRSLPLPVSSVTENSPSDARNFHTAGMSEETSLPPKLSAEVHRNEEGIGALNMVEATAKRRCSFRAKRRLITSSEIMKMNLGPKRDEPTVEESLSRIVEPCASREPAEKPEEPRDFAPERVSQGMSGQVGNTLLSIDQTPRTLQGRSWTSSGYVSYSSFGSSRASRKPDTLQKKPKTPSISLKTQVDALRTNFGVLKLLLSRLSFDFKSAGVTCEATSASIPTLSKDGFSPGIVEYGVRLAYLDILAPRQSVLVDADWFRGIEIVIVHLFRHGMVSETGVQHSSGVARCFKVVALIAVEIPEVTDLIFKLLELTIKKRVPSASAIHRKYMAWQTSLLCKNCPRLALRMLKLLTSEFAAMLVSLHQNPGNYAVNRSVTFFLSNLILDILLQLPKGCGHALKSIADDLENIPTNAHLLSLAKQDIMDHVDFKLQPYTR